MTLKPKGTRSNSDIEPALFMLERATSNAMALRGVGGVLNLSIPASWGNHWLIPRSGGFTKAHSEISLNVFTKLGAADFSNRQIDAAVEYRTSPRADLACELVMVLSLSPYASPAWKRQNAGRMEPVAMLQHTAIPLAWNGWLNQCGRGDLLPADTRQDIATGPRYDLMFMAMNAAVAGLGMALLPEFLAAPLVTSRRLTRLSSTTWQAPGGYYLSRSPLLRSEAAFAAFRDWLRSEIRSSCA